MFHFFQIIKELIEIDVRSVMASTPNVQIMLIQGRPSPLNLWSIIPPLSEKHVYKKYRNNFSSSSAKISYNLYFSHRPHPRL